MAARRAASGKGSKREAADGPVRITRLDNGFTVITEAMPQLRTVALGVWVQAGARHELEHEHGLAHFLEHMAFKGTETRSAREIAEGIEEVGGDLNASTSTEHTAYYARVLGEDIGVGVDILADIVLRPAFDPQELEREKDVILQEIAGIQDSPDDVIYDLAQGAAFDGQAIGRTIIGTPTSVKALTVDDLHAYRARNYTGPNLVLSAAGAVDHDRIVDLAAAQFAGLSAQRGGSMERPSFVGGRRSSRRAFEQAHVLMALDGPAYRAPDYYAAQVFSGAFGGGMSSRLFQEVRERRGLCYAIYSSVWGLSDCGLVMIHAATSEASLAQLSDVIVDELDAVVRDGIGDKELLRSKAQLKAGLMMSLESPTARAEQMARQYLAYARALTAEELIEKVDRVTADDVAAFARDLRARDRLVTAVVGAGRKSDTFAAQAAQRFLETGTAATGGEGRRWRS